MIIFFKILSYAVTFIFSFSALISFLLLISENLILVIALSFLLSFYFVLKWYTPIIPSYLTSFLAKKGNSD